MSQLLERAARASPNRHSLLGNGVVTFYREASWFAPNDPKQRVLVHIRPEFRWMVLHVAHALAFVAAMKIQPVVRERHQLFVIRIAVREDIVGFDVVAILVNTASLQAFP